jgi:hypothetical protein
MSQSTCLKAGQCPVDIEVERPPQPGVKLAFPEIQKAEPRKSRQIGYVSVTNLFG